MCRSSYSSILAFNGKIDENEYVVNYLQGNSNWKLRWFSPTWTNLDQLGPTWTNLNQLEPTWTNLNQLGPTWTNLNQLEPTWTNLNQLGPAWTNLNQLGPTWTNLNQLGLAWTNGRWRSLIFSRLHLKPKQVKECLDVEVENQRNLNKSIMSCSS